MTDLGKILIGLGALLLIGGAIILVLGRMNVPIGRLPGDFSWRNRSGNTQVYFPLATCLILSAILSAILWLINSIRR